MKLAFGKPASILRVFTVKACYGEVYRPVAVTGIDYQVVNRLYVQIIQYQLVSSIESIKSLISMLTFTDTLHKMPLLCFKNYHAKPEAFECKAGSIQCTRTRNRRFIIARRRVHSLCQC